jgi:hypothetical protein
MSQFFVGISAGSLPPSVPTSFVTDSGTVIPAANIVNFNGGSTSVDNSNGIQVIANADGSNNGVFRLTNRLTGSGTSTNASVLSLNTFALGASAGVYRFEFIVSGRDVVSGDGIGYTVFSSAKTDGVTATVISTPFIDNDEDASLVAASADFIASGNNVILQVTGVSGRTINYKAVGTYVVV